MSSPLDGRTRKSIPPSPSKSAARTRVAGTGGKSTHSVREECAGAIGRENAQLPSRRNGDDIVITVSVRVGRGDDRSGLERGNRPGSFLVETVNSVRHVHARRAIRRHDHHVSPAVTIYIRREQLDVGTANRRNMPRAKIERRLIVVHIQMAGEDASAFGLRGPRSVSGRALYARSAKPREKSTAMTGERPVLDQSRRRRGGSRGGGLPGKLTRMETPACPSISMPHQTGLALRITKHLTAPGE